MEEFDRILDEEAERLKNLGDLSEQHVKIAFQVANNNLKIFKPSFISETNFDEKIEIRQHFIDTCFKETMQKVELKPNQTYAFYEICSFLFNGILVKD